MIAHPFSQIRVCFDRETDALSTMKERTESIEDAQLEQRVDSVFFRLNGYGRKLAAVKKSAMTRARRMSSAKSRPQVFRTGWILRRITVTADPRNETWLRGSE